MRWLNSQAVARLKLNQHLAAVFLGVLLVAGCEKRVPTVELSPPSPGVEVVTPLPPPSMEIVSWSDLPSTLFQDRAIRSWATALEGSAAYYRKLTPSQVFQFGPLQLTAQGANCKTTPWSAARRQAYNRPVGKNAS